MRCFCEVANSESICKLVIGKAGTKTSIGKVIFTKDSLQLCTKLPDKINSKNKRKLTRQWERDRDAEVVHQEALKLLEEMKPAASPPKVEEQKNSKKLKADWNHLTPEERLRREEQRRLQQEAAKRREQGVVLGGQQHKHPLNSERRRANRGSQSGSNLRKGEEKMVLQMSMIHLDIT